MFLLPSDTIFNVVTALFHTKWLHANTEKFTGNQVFFAEISISFFFFIVAAGKKLHSMQKREKILNEPVTHELKETYTHIAGFWSQSLKTSVDTFTRKDFFCQRVCWFILIDTTKFNGWLEWPWKTTNSVSWNWS